MIYSPERYVCAEGKIGPEKIKATGSASSAVLRCQLRIAGGLSRRVHVPP